MLDAALCEDLLHSDHADSWHQGNLSFLDVEIPICNGSKNKYKLGSIICHQGFQSKAGHFWAHLLYDNDVVITANELS